MRNRPSFTSIFTCANTFSGADTTNCFSESQVSSTSIWVSVIRLIHVCLPLVLVVYFRLRLPNSFILLPSLFNDIALTKFKNLENDGM